MPPNASVSRRFDRLGRTRARKRTAETPEDLTPQGRDRGFSGPRLGSGYAALGNITAREDGTGDSKRSGSKRWSAR